ncbi:CHASE domain-containing protein [Thalassotalea hakodatensis]|uniref:CHASE domain-containing protein n=1 Tax=Thalassotalea hakodatensis TaxID=3030492 RepID=UPI0025733AF4|nr:CHASE domain-containing protein [Thalassotalea hakodatensis]
MKIFEGLILSLFKLSFTKQQYLFSCFIIIFGLIFSTYQQFSHEEKIESQIQQALKTRLNFITNGIIERLDHYALGVASLHSTILSHDPSYITHKTIHTFSNAQNYPERYKGARGFGLIKPVTIQQESQFTEQANQDRPDNKFSIKSLTPHHKTRYIIQYIFPESVNNKAIGLDVGSEKNRRVTLENAALNNQTTLTAPITLVQATGKVEHGFLLVKPVYHNNSIPKSVKEIEDTVYGWTYAPLLIGEILATVTQVGDDLLAISDTTDKVPFYQAQAENLTSMQYMAKTVPIYGRTWEIKLFSTEKFLQNLNLPHQYLGLMTGTIFTLVTLLSYFLLHLALQRKAQLAQYQIDLAKAREEKLTLTNSQLSTAVANKTDELIQANLLNDSILKNAAYAVIATDKTGIIQVFNPAAEKLLGYRADELINTHSPAIFHLEREVIAKSIELSKELNEDITPGFEVFVVKTKYVEIDTNQWTYVSKSGQHIQVRLSVTSLANSTSESLGYLGIAYDLTETLQHEHELKEAKIKAEQASIAKSEFLANMSHELRTPLNGVYGTIQLLKEQDFDANNKKLISTAYHSTKSLITIINDILDFSKIEAGKLELENEVFKLPVLMEQLNSELSLLLQGKNINLSFDNQVQDECWLGDIVRIRQILINLISNAIKFTEKGSVSITASAEKHNGVLFTIKDTGIGIDQQTLKRLFNRFEQADSSTTRRFGGTGLGFPISDKLVKLMKGSIDVESEINKGTTIAVALPLTAVTGDKSTTVTLDTLYPDMHDKTILIAEDNKINQLVISKMMKPTNANIVMANDGVDAINKFHICAPDFIFMDIQMPEMDGLTACKKIKAEAPEQPIIALTANALKSEQDLYRQYFDGYLSKPLEKDKLIKELNRLLRE